MIWFGKAAKEKMRLSIIADIKRDEQIKQDAIVKSEDELRNSDEPWVVVRGTVLDATKGAKIELDWNTAFIDYLKKNNITGADEDVIIQKYIMLLLKDMTESFDDAGNEYE